MTRTSQPKRADLAELFEENKEGLAGSVRGILGPSAEVHEVLQDAFVKAWDAWSEETASEIRDAVAWVFVLTMNLAKDLRRKRSRRAESVPLEEVDPVVLSSRAPGPMEKVEREEWLAAARAAILQLDAPEKDVFLLKVSGGRTFAAIAQALGIPEGTAKTRMRSALRRLRQTLKSFGSLPIERALDDSVQENSR